VLHGTRLHVYVPFYTDVLHALRPYGTANEYHFRQQNHDVPLSVCRNTFTQSPSDGSPVRAGSRRRQRMEKERDILRGMELTDEEVKALYRVTTSSMFCELFEDQTRMEKWVRFCSETEERQDELMKSAARPVNARKMTQDPRFVAPICCHCAMSFLSSKLCEALLIFWHRGPKQQ